LLPDLDSNQDKQNQNLRYYRYTIGQFLEELPFQKAGTNLPFILIAAKKDWGPGHGAPENKKVSLEKDPPMTLPYEI
jgi:hypothetical protein